MEVPCVINTYKKGAFIIDKRNLCGSMTSQVGVKEAFYMSSKATKA